MKESYSFTSDIEPTDEQLNGLMQAVLEEVKQRAVNANKAFEALQLQQIKEAFEKRTKKLNTNA